VNIRIKLIWRVDIRIKIVWRVKVGCRATILAKILETFSPETHQITTTSIVITLAEPIITTTAKVSWISKEKLPPP
jgi:hypothetical protein